MKIVSRRNYLFKTQKHRNNMSQQALGRPTVIQAEERKNCMAGQGWQLCAVPKSMNVMVRCRVFVVAWSANLL